MVGHVEGGCLLGAWEHEALWGKAGGSPWVGMGIGSCAGHMTLFWSAECGCRVMVDMGILGDCFCCEVSSVLQGALGCRQVLGHLLGT